MNEVSLTFRLFHEGALLREVTFHQTAVVKIGKIPSATLKLDEEGVSRMHAIIEVNSPGDVSIVDLGSVRGTFVNGQKISKCVLHSGDILMIGATRIEFTIGYNASEVPAP